MIGTLLKIIPKVTVKHYNQRNGNLEFMTFNIERLWILILLFLWLVPGMVLAYQLIKKFNFLGSLRKHSMGYVILGLLINLGVSVIFLLIPQVVGKILRMVYLLGGLVWGLVLLWRAKSVIKMRMDFWLLALGLGLLIGQLYFSNQLIFPSNTDSITHYRYIERFLDWRGEGLSLIQFIKQLRFYHYGFHLIVSEIHAFTGFAVTDIMLSLGTFSVILAPFTLMLPFENLEFDKKAQRWAVFGIALAMLFPDFAQNWGKYPALLSAVLLLLPLTLILDMAKDDKKEKLSVKLLTLVAISASVGMAHWRSLVVLVVIGLAAFIYYGVFKEHVPVWVIGLFVVCAAYFLLKDRARFNSSTGQFIFWLVLIVLAIGLMAVRVKNKSTNKLVLSLLMYLGVRLCVELPLDKIMPQFDALVDMPYFRIVTFIFVGLFVGTLLDEMRRISLNWTGFTVLKKRYLHDLVALLAVSLLLIAVPVQRKWSPPNAYKLIGEQQKEVLDWALEAYQGQNMKLLVAGTPLLDYVEYADAGGWLAEMGDFDIVFAIDSVDLNRSGVHARMCREDVGLVFADYSRATVFSPKVMLDPELYDTLFETEDVRLISPKCE